MRREAVANMLAHSESESTSFKKAILNQKSQKTVTGYSKSENNILSDEARFKKNILKSVGQLRDALPPGSKKVTFNKEVAHKEIKLYRGESLDRCVRSNSEENLTNSSDFIRTLDKPAKVCTSFSYNHLSLDNKRREESVEELSSSSNKNNSFSSESLDEEENMSKLTLNSYLPPPPPPNDDYGNSDSAPFPFPLPSYGDLISRTDLNSAESLNNSSSSSGNSQIYSYINSTNEEMVIH
jgi:hypothetical protein